MKKTNILLVLAVLTIFIIGVIPAALAKQEGKPLKIMESDENTSEGYTIGQSLVKAEGVVVAKEERSGLVGKFKEARQKYEQFKEKRSQAAEKMKEQKKELLGIHEKSKACKDEETTECQQAHTELKKGVKQHLLKTEEVISASLEKIASRIESAETLTAEEKAQLTAELTAKTAELTVLQAKINAMTENASAAEYKAAIKELKEKWTEIKKIEQKSISYLISSKMENLVEKVTTDYAIKMQAKVDELKTAGADTTSLETLLADYNTKAGELKTAQVAANAKLLSGDTTGYKAEQKVVKEKFQAVQQVLKAFFAQVRELKLVKAAAEETPTSEAATEGIVAEAVANE